MTQTPPPKSSSSPTERAPEQAAPGQAPEPNYARAFAKGCGWTTLAVVLGIGVVFVGKGEMASVGSALIGALFLILILGTSGLTGWWNK